LATYTPEPRAYELMVLYSPELGEEALEAEMNRVSDQLVQAGAEILRSKSTTPWGRRRLAYPIQNFQDAFYVLYSLSSQPGDLDPFERDLKLNTNVIRYLLIRQEKAEALEDEPEPEAAAEETAESPEAAEAADDSDESNSDEPAEDASEETEGGETSAGEAESTDDDSEAADSPEDAEDGSDDERA
jgi:small subunit ribosomal protein S6